MGAGYFDSAPLILWWDTGTHTAREEAQFVELATASFEMRATRGLVAGLGTLEARSRALQVAFAVRGIKPQRAHQRVSGVADLADGDLRVFPPEAARFRGPGTNDSPS